MFQLRVCLLLLSAALLCCGCDSRSGSGVSKEEATMTPEDYDAKIEAEESQRDESGN